MNFSSLPSCIRNNIFGQERLQPVRKDSYFWPDKTFTGCPSSCVHTMKSCQLTAQSGMGAALGQLPVKTGEVPITFLGLWVKFQVEPTRIRNTAREGRVVRLYCSGCIQ